MIMMMSISILLLLEYTIKGFEIITRTYMVGPQTYCVMSLVMLPQDLVVTLPFLKIFKVYQ